MDDVYIGGATNCPADRWIRGIHGCMDGWLAGWVDGWLELLDYVSRCQDILSMQMQQEINAKSDRQTHGHISE